ncbi:hypothetical protein [Duganella vulcania]|uniref:Uncharacterized protein n=1 Tax=Duganella vulcania TaxID=2692166 RepID=A0A845GHY5_9BURK|nr:hypothetical protein [Duganella vulcania]MYM92377.1 hypothetical protein [Duganella vulcania]
MQVDVQPGAAGFTGHVYIRDGGLDVDPACAPAELLHEAAHLAVIGARYRPWFSGDIRSGMARMFDDITRLRLPPDHPIERAALQSGELEATAWSWAAGVAIGLPSKEIIHDADFSGAGAATRLELQLGQHRGINGLYHAGMCARARPGVANPYPAMLRWLQE